MDLSILHENKNQKVCSLCLEMSKGKHKAKAREDTRKKKQGNRVQYGWEHFTSLWELVLNITYYFTVLYLSTGVIVC